MADILWIAGASTLPNDRRQPGLTKHSMSPMTSTSKCRQRRSQTRRQLAISTSRIGLRQCKICRIGRVFRTLGLSWCPSLGTGRHLLLVSPMMFYATATLVGNRVGENTFRKTRVDNSEPAEAPRQKRFPHGATSLDDTS